MLTNNPLIRDYNLSCDVEYMEGPLLDVLLEAKRYIVDEKRTIHTHPLSSSIKPNETVYKTIILSSKNHPYIDLESLELIENAIDVHGKFQANFQTPNWSERILNDFALIDFDLIMSTLPRMTYAD